MSNSTMTDRAITPVEFTCYTPDELELKVKVRKDDNPFRKGRMYLWHSSDTILSDFTRRVNHIERPYTFYRKAILPTLVRELALGDTKFKWSKYAGCSCSCNPGFICESPSLRGLVVSVLVKPL